jgi:transcription elongation GreA/GreB family factor
MSRAFVKDAEDGDGEDLPDRLISPHPNFVTKEGLAQIEAEVERLTREYAAAQTAADRAALSVTARDLRYWTARRASAELIVPPTDAKEVHFGSTVTFRREDGRTQTYRIVGEDEADPAKGTLSYVSPLARALMGKAVGDSIPIAHGQVEVVEVR